MASVAIFSACALWGPGLVGPADAQEKFINLGGSVQQVVLPPNDTITIATGKPFGDLVIGSAELIDVVPLSDKSLFIRGKKTGRLTSLSMVTTRSFSVSSTFVLPAISAR